MSEPSKRQKADYTYTDKALNRVMSTADLNREFKLEQFKVELIPIHSIFPNAYNSNRHSEHDFELLLRSITEDGFTQPIVVDLKDNQIVDGEHRWRAMITLGFEQIPVVFVDMTEAQRRISTLRHNRARGNEELEITGQIFRDLEKLGAIAQAQSSLQMDSSEISRLLAAEVSAAASLAAESFSKSWEPSKTGSDIAAHINSENPSESIKMGNKEISVSPDAVQKMRDNEQQMQQAKNQEEKDMLRKQRETETYNLQLVYWGDQARIVREVLGKSPSERLMQIILPIYMASHPDITETVEPESEEEESGYPHDPNDFVEDDSSEYEREDDE